MDGTDSSHKDEPADAEASVTPASKPVATRNESPSGAADSEQSGPQTPDVRAPAGPSEPPESARADDGAPQSTPASERPPRRRRSSRPPRASDAFGLGGRGRGEDADADLEEDGDYEDGDDRRDSESPWGRSRLPEILRKGLEKGIETGLQTWEKSIETGLNTWEKSIETSREKTGQVRERLQDGKLPKELAGAVFNQIEDTKNGVLRVVAREVREFLEATDISTEIKNALTSLSFEIKTEVRFIPNDAGTGVKPDIKSNTSVKVAEEEPKRGRRRRKRRPEADDT